ncbi:ABC transporter permease [Arthrobacter sp. Sa2BUA2]|uniref:ABC transporter permease n=1 Tax=Arthrobacter pullicola TaxID=2762224 RepID=A0ABR8YIP1_9MICC|nr:ABC transporter permease [Arthrobacter pullicola]MBD8044080.1 ABC transporter permease [Arthrobacter pullicola]
MDYTSDNVLVQMFEWLTYPANWEGPRGIPVRIVEHLGYTALAVGIAALIAVPLGLYIGHTGRGRVVVVSGTGILRALPTLGLVFLFVLLAGIGLMPPIWALVLLAMPPLLAGVYAGISSVDRTIVDAARAMGMNEFQILFRVELPNGLKVAFGGFRAAVLQVLATVSVVAFISLGGLGVYLIEGTQLRDNGRLFGGALLIALLALAVDLVLAAVQRLVLSPGLRTSSARKPAAPSHRRAQPAVRQEGATS